MTNLEIFIAAIGKIARENWPIILYIIVGVVVIARREKVEKKRSEEVIKRDKLKREHHQKYIA